MLVALIMHINHHHIKLQSQPLTTDYDSSRPQPIVPAHSYTGGCISLIALITHMGRPQTQTASHCSWSH